MLLSGVEVVCVKLPRRGSRDDARLAVPIERLLEDAAIRAVDIEHSDAVARTADDAERVGIDESCRELSRRRNTHVLIVRDRLELSLAPGHDDDLAPLPRASDLAAAFARLRSSGHA